MTNQPTEAQEQLSFFPEETLDGKVERATQIIRLACDMSKEYYGKPLIICYSGGKDSDVLLDIARKSGGDIEVLNSHTTADAPQTVRHIKEVFADCEKDGIHTTVSYPTYKGERTSMWGLIPEKGIPPTRVARYCCKVLKETATPNRFVALGVRKDESTRRRDRCEFEVRGENLKVAPKYSYEHTKEVYQDAHTHDEVWDCKLITNAKKNKDLICNPIVNFTDEDVWLYIERNGIKTNPLYEKGYKRVGCIGCPMGTMQNRTKAFEDFPKYKLNYIKAFDRMLEKAKQEGKERDWKNGEEVFEWWLGYEKGVEQLDGQQELTD